MRARDSRVRMAGLMALMLLAGWLSAPALDAPQLDAGKEVTVLPPGFVTSMRVYAPTNYAADRSWPVLFFYPGQHGAPTISPIREYCGGKDFILVGMPYAEDLKKPLMPQEAEGYVQKELTNFRTARGWVTSHANVDTNRVFMGGMSKGGWMTSVLGERELPRIAGFVILMAGRQRTAGVTLPVGAVATRPIFIAAGETDPNLLSALEAREFYRRNGAVVTWEVYAGCGHEVPPDSKVKRLRQWLEAQGACRQRDTGPAAVEAAAKTLREALGKALAATETAARYAMLADLAEDPRLPLCGEELAGEVGAQLAQARKGQPFRDEWEAEQWFSHYVWLDWNTKTLGDMKTVRDGFKKINETYPNTVYGRISTQSYARVSAWYDKSYEVSRKALEAMKKQAAKSGAGAASGVTAHMGSNYTIRIDHPDLPKTK